MTHEGLQVASGWDFVRRRSARDDDSLGARVSARTSYGGFFQGDECIVIDEGFGGHRWWNTRGSMIMARDVGASNIPEVRFP